MYIAQIRKITNKTASRSPSRDRSRSRSYTRSRSGSRSHSRSVRSRSRSASFSPNRIPHRSNSEMHQLSIHHSSNRSSSNTNNHTNTNNNNNNNSNNYNNNNNNNNHNNNNPFMPPPSSSHHRSRDRVHRNERSHHRNEHRSRHNRDRHTNNDESPQESTYANALKGSSGRTFNIFVKNLPRTCMKQDLMELFGRFGTIFSCAVIKRKKNPSTKCFGFVNFATEEAQKKACRASGKIHMNDSMIECEMSSNVTVVYMGNLPLDVNKSDIRYHVRTHGDRYRSLHIRHGHCFIVYESYYAAERAIQSLQNTQLNGSQVWVAIASETKAKMLSTTQEAPSQRSLFIGNLALTVKEDELQDRFTKYGKVTSVRIPRIHTSNKPRGFAFIEFDNSGDAELAIRGENGKNLHSQKMDIDWCRDNMSRDGGPGGGPQGGGNGHGSMPPPGMPINDHVTGYNGGPHDRYGGGGGSGGHIQPVRFMHHLDNKTLESLPVMEVEPGKFVKVIPASFMQCMLYIIIIFVYGFFFRLSFSFFFLDTITFSHSRK